ncbi:MAG: hypothetical protein WCV81_05050 [Microgenomates group bacterium]|jgi:hypothetical protein
MDRRIETPKFSIEEGQKFEASILAGGKVLETYPVLLKEIRSRDVVLMEIEAPSRILTVSKRAFVTGKIGIMEFNPVLEEKVI